MGSWTPLPVQSQFVTRAREHAAPRERALSHPHALSHLAEVARPSSDAGARHVVRERVVDAVSVSVAHAAQLSGADSARLVGVAVHVATKINLFILFC